MQITAVLAAVIMAVPAVMGAATPNPPTYGNPPTRPPPPFGPKRVLQEWFGTAPLCNGKCPAGWDTVLYADRAGACQSSTSYKIVESCRNLSSHKCATGRKVLCEYKLSGFQH
ncbi:hypothetical protein TWF569_007889 [Orbilia oligospora]|uniref:Uncharacterized protein n=1 Tax=Orbilia oligospora TaxID=2813651 RepID=A0A7C8PBU5_ORBOL|nr:hypothetical protein TWF102_000409 [Orbilia oligospora]KAF3113870.1 hypothetical protein TWF706_009236 [Orbilia oligospora]KAF3115880.1 hypothetical protein TWF103_010116 [Orbilia oligospora]KAF3142473.1 hypothetical protein TWF703_000862 [Orbilia oligospora]KAF3149581.1 hypothetical protein TWF594_010687 [Orbilia oligospora]